MEIMAASSDIIIHTPLEDASEAPSADALSAYSLPAKRIVPFLLIICMTKPIGVSFSFPNIKMYHNIE